MPKLIVCNVVSLDGYYEGADKNIMALFDYRRETYPVDDSFDVYNAERLRSADILLTGRTSYEAFKNYWPPLVNDANASPVEREISRLNNAISKVVISDTLESDPTNPWNNSTRIVRRADTHQAVTDLKKQSGKDILVFGSRTLWNDLLAHDLVDELHLMIAPVVLGTGTPIFVQDKFLLKLIDNPRGWKNSGNVLVRYQPVRKKG